MTPLHKQKFKPTLKDYPLTSGVYLMKDNSHRVIYVGKAVSLRRRLASYFSRSAKDPKTRKLVEAIRSIDFILTQSEAEALILEASLIKKYKPHFNIDLRDDKSYPYIEVTGETFPRIYMVRPRAFSARSKYFGPFVNPRLIREALKIIRKIFHFRTCEPLPKKECLDYHMGLCDAPCIGEINRRNYKKNIRRVVLILEGKKDALFSSLQREMEELAANQNFESAAKLRDQIRALGALYQGARGTNYLKEAEQLQRALGVKRKIVRIEAFDISNTFGEYSVGSMVSFFNGKPDKGQYRRFRIRQVQGIDDVRMIGEIVGRRYRRVLKEGMPFPDLILIDGGKGQLSKAVGELKKLYLDIPIVSLAKREEEIFVFGKRNPIILPRDSLSLQLMQRVRDEAHRFAISYHRKLREKGLFKA